jgi:hypothetical protein
MTDLSPTRLKMAGIYCLRSSSSKPWTRECNPLGLKRMKLVYKFAKHVIVTFQNSEADCVQPFLKPVDPEADGATDYNKVQVPDGFDHHAAEIGRRQV